MFGLFENNYKKVKVYGERNTGSRYLEWLLNKNLKVEILSDLQLGWRHKLIEENDKIIPLTNDTLILVIVKNPYSWLLSMHRKPKQHPELETIKFSNFLRYSYGDYENPITLYNKKYNGFFSLEGKTDKYEIIRYEDLLADSEKQIKYLAEKYEIKKTFNWFKDTSLYIKNAKETRSNSFSKSYYLNQAWIKEISSTDFQYINSLLDISLLDKCKYKKIA